MSTSIWPVGLEDIRAAHKLLQGVARVTPLEGSRPLGAKVGGPVHLKCENLQRAGSFKIRGAYVRIANLSNPQMIDRQKRFMPNVKVLTFDTPSAMFLAVKSGQAQAMQMDSPVIDWYAAPAIGLRQK